MTPKTQTLERELIKKGFKPSAEFKDFQFWNNGNKMVLYDMKNGNVIPYDEDDDICEYINQWRRI